LFYGFRESRTVSNVYSNQENENSEFMEIVWIADWGYPGPGYRYENFVAYLWWPDNAEFLRIRWYAFNYYAGSREHTWWWDLDDNEIVYGETKYGPVVIDSLPEWLLPHMPEFSLVEMDTPTGRRTVAKITQKEYWENMQYNINVWIRIPRRIAENREFTGIELGENINLLGQRYWSDKAYFYFDYEPKKPMGQVFHLNLGDFGNEGVYMNTLLTATIIPGRWIKSKGYRVSGYEIL